MITQKWLLNACSAPLMAQATLLWVIMWKKLVRNTFVDLFPLKSKTLQAPPIFIIFVPILKDRISPIKVGCSIEIKDIYLMLSK